MEISPLISRILSTIIFAFIIFGVTQRRNRKVHIPTMVSCFVADITLLLFVELSRGAIERVQAGELPLILRIHLLFSVPMVGSWLLALFAGYHRRKGRLVKLHFINACLFLTLRTGNWITAFFVE